MLKLLFRQKYYLLVLVIVAFLMNFFYTYIGLKKKQIESVAAKREPLRNELLVNASSSGMIMYPDLLKCSHNYDSMALSEADRMNYSLPAEEKLQKIRFVRGVLVYYPVERHPWFEEEFRWLYRSWIEMQKYESVMWRTDLIVFLDAERLKLANASLFQDLNCSVHNVRKTRKAKPMCTIQNYIAVKDRELPVTEPPVTDTVTPASEEIYEYFFKQYDVYNNDPKYLNQFYGKLKELIDYNYIDSILMAFDGYNYLKDNFDFLLRTDMDVFMTPLLAKWLPRNCNDFIVGSGGYSHDFNMKRFRRAAKVMNLGFANLRNLGSTWISTPKQFRLVAYHTLISMLYLSAEEFSETERQGKVGTILWPEWHYGVLLLYGQNLAMNHLVGSKQINVTALGDLIDYPSANVEKITSKLHIHVYHGEDLFSKFMFRDGRYDNLTGTGLDISLINNYCLSLALESKRMKYNSFYPMLQNVTSKKI